MNDTKPENDGFDPKEYFNFLFYCQAFCFSAETLEKLYHEADENFFKSLQDRTCLEPAESCHIRFTPEEHLDHSRRIFHHYVLPYLYFHGLELGVKGLAKLHKIVFERSHFAFVELLKELRLNGILNISEADLSVVNEVANIYSFLRYPEEEENTKNNAPEIDYKIGDLICTQKAQNAYEYMTCHRPGEDLNRLDIIKKICTCVINTGGILQPIKESKKKD